MAFSSHTEIFSYIQQALPGTVFTAEQFEAIVKYWPSLSAEEKNTLAQYLACDMQQCETFFDTDKPDYLSFSRWEQNLNARIAQRMKSIIFTYHDPEPFALNRLKWSHLEWTIQTLQRKKLSQHLIRQTWAEVLGVPYSIICLALTRPQPERSVKRAFSYLEQTETENKYRSKRRRIEKEDTRLRVNSNNSFFPEKIRETYNIKKCPLQPVTPVRDGSPEVFRTPNRTRVKRLFISRIDNEPHDTVLYKAETPQRKIIRNKNRRTFDNIVTKQFHFIATLPDLPQKAANLRLRSQNTLMGGSCRKKFEDDGFETPSGNNTLNWSHVIGLCIGGVHSKENIMGATREANVKMLNIIEQHVLCLLREKKTSKVTILMTVRKETSSDIPLDLKCDLHYNIQGKTRHQQCFINLRSMEKISSTQKAVIHALQNYEDNEESAPEHPESPGFF